MDGERASAQTDGTLADRRCSSRRPSSSCGPSTPRSPPQTPSPQTPSPKHLRRNIRRRHRRDGLCTRRTQERIQPCLIYLHAVSLVRDFAGTALALAVSPWLSFVPFVPFVLALAVSPWLFAAAASCFVPCVPGASLLGMLDSLDIALPDDHACPSSSPQLRCSASVR